MSVKQRYRFAAKLARAIAAGGLTTVVACASAPEDDPEPETPQERIERDMERIEALGVLDMEGMADVDMSAEQQATRLEAFTDLAERAVADIGVNDISDQWQTETGEPTLCVRGGDDSFCLTIELHAENLRRVNALEVITVSDIIRSDAPSSGFCYSSWETVNETDCVRGLKLGAIADLAEDDLE